MCLFAHFMLFNTTFFGLPGSNLLVKSLLNLPISSDGEDEGCVDDSGTFLNGGVMLLAKILIVLLFFIA